MQLVEGTIVADRFRLIRVLGQGGMGSVWLVHHTALDVPCALKFIHGEALPSSIAPESGRRAGTSLIDIGRPLPEVAEDLVGRVEREYFSRLLVKYKGNVARCARHSGLSRRSVTQKLQKYALDRSMFLDSAVGEDA